MKRTLAMDCSFVRDTADRPSIWGFDVATDGIVDALLRYGTYDRYILFYPPGRRPDRLVRGEHGRPTVDLRFQLTPAIPAEIASGDITTWFQPDTRTLTVNYRTAFGRTPFPFATLIHTAWASHLIRKRYLWMLIDGFAPCDSVICTSRAVRRTISDTLDYLVDEMRTYSGAHLKYRGRLDVLPLGVDTQRFKPQPKPGVRRILGWPDDAFIILWLGRFSAVDKADLLPALRMFRHLLQTNTRTRLLFVLAGKDQRDIPFLPSMREFATSMGVAEQILVLDDTSTEQSHRLFAAADVFFSPVDSFQETFGITPVEAMACGTPQVVADWDGYKDTTVHGVTGYRIPTYWHWPADVQTNYGLGGTEYVGFLLSQSVVIDLRECQAALQRLIDDPDLRESMSRASRKRALEVFRWQSVVERYEELWTELGTIARALKHQDLPTSPFLHDGPQRFSGFPTAILDGSEPVAISDDGCKLLSGADPFPWHSSLERALVDGDDLMAILDLVRRHPGTLSQVAARLATDKPERAPVAFRALLWAMKHGLLDYQVFAHPSREAGFARS